MRQVALVFKKSFLIEDLLLDSCPESMIGVLAIVFWIFRQIVADSDTRDFHEALP